jgi:hypothetical protein
VLPGRELWAPAKPIAMVASTPVLSKMLKLKSREVN